MCALAPCFFVLINRLKANLNSPLNASKNSHIENLGIITKTTVPFGLTRYLNCDNTSDRLLAQFKPAKLLKTQSYNCLFSSLSRSLKLHNSGVIFEDNPALATLC